MIANPGSPLEQADPDEVRAALAEPSFYPSPPSQVLVRETHISWVFLAGDRAYKLKKPVVLPFLDYGSAERRRRMCDEEVRLNRRLARDLYIAVRSVAAGEHGLRLASEHDPDALDYLVEMRRYDERSTLAARLECGGPEALGEDVAALAKLLARFHARTRTVAVDRGGALGVRRRAEENLQELLLVVGSPAEADRVRALGRFTDAFLAGDAAELERRARAGLVVEGHGDLRAEHVLLNGAPRVVDCIEFDPRRRELDVADELAFLVMDLTMRGAQDLARQLVAAYRRAGGDPGEERLIAFYACFRALVRAKVRLLRGAQLPPRSSERRDQSAAARELLALAERFAWRARLPLVIAICGAPAAGKSELATALSRASGLRHLSSDVVRKRAAGLAPNERAPAAVYDASWNARTYLELGRRAALETSARGGALVDATFRRRADREAFARGFAGSAPVLFVECHAPARVLAERAARRERETDRISDATLPVVVRESARWEPLEEVMPQAHVTLRSDRPVEAMLADLIALLDSRIGLPGAPASRLTNLVGNDT